MGLGVLGFRGLRVLGLGVLGFWGLGGLGFRGLRVLGLGVLGCRARSRHRVLAGGGAYLCRSHWCVAANPPHDHLEFKLFKAIHSETGHDVMCFQVLAFGVAVLSNGSFPK